MGVNLSTKGQKRNEVLYFICAALTPMFFCILWLLANNQLPSSDGTDYIGTAQDIYQHFVDEGFRSGILNLFTERGWRPILFPVLSVPFLLMSQGSMMFAYNAAAVFCILASVAYIYLYLRFYLDTLSASVAASLICLLPFVQMPAFMFFAEAALFPAIFGSLYHLIRSNYFRNRNHTIGFIICISLALLLRPIEALTELFFVCIAFFAMGGYQRIFSIKQMMTVITIILATVFIFLFFIISYYVHNYPYPSLTGSNSAKFLYKFSMVTFGSLLLAGASLVFMNTVTKYKNRWQPQGQSWYSPQVIIVFSIIAMIALLWFLPFSFQTYNWIFETSFGEVANIFLQSNPKQSAWTVLYAFLTEEGIIASGGILFVSLLGMMVMNKNKIREVIMSPAFYYLLLLLMVPFPLWEVLNTCQTGSRKLSLAFTGLLVALLFFGLQRGKLWLFRFLIIISLLIAQFANGFDNKLTTRLGIYPVAVSVQPNPHDVVLGFLDSNALKYQMKNIAISESWVEYMPIYPYLLMRMTKFNHAYTISYPFYGNSSDNIFEKMTQSHDGIFLIEKQNRMTITDSIAKENDQRFVKETSPDLKILYGLINHYSSNTLNEIGLKRGPCTAFKGNNREFYTGCLLIPLKNSLSPDKYS